jgi:hypothetical protein
MDGLGDCNNPSIKQISSTGDGTNMISEYKMNIEKNPPGGSVTMLITFSQPVTPSRITITGDVSDN